MKEQIDAILFDMGGTLRSTNKPLHEVNKDLIREMIILLGMNIGELELILLLQEHARAYKNWAQNNLLELNEINIWTRWMLPDWPSDQVSRHALGLSQLWRAATVKYDIFPETKEVICALFRRGYRLGLVSNTTSSVEAPGILQELGIAGCFDAVVLSCVVGIRKPDPAILLLAAGQMGVDPDRCAFIGDQPGRDVAAARKAGFSKAIILRDPAHRKPEQLSDPALTPDHVIRNLNDLLEIFQPRPTPKPDIVYDASLSTMWSKKNFPTLGEFFEAAHRIGFASIELNHQVTTSMLDGMDLSQYQFSSVHEPCPADISVEILKMRDWMISSTDEDCRKHGVEAIKRSLDLAKKLSAHTIVIHCGHISPDMTLENELRKLYEANKKNSVEYQEKMAFIVDNRRNLIAPCMDAVEKSLKELLQYASQYGIRLGLENRYHYFDIPSQDEMARLLDLADPEQLGFIYDTGHAQAMNNLGFYPQKAWLDRFSKRIIGTHLHDAVGITDHYAPGLGEVDFKQLAGYLSVGSFRTMEVQPQISFAQVRFGLKKLFETGCIRPI